ncbi:MAG: hypothetical protein V1728_02385 [Candidatus Micrarchaeota archaeon]
MPVPKNRSNSVRKIKYRTPQGDSRTRYRRRIKGTRHHCAVSGQLLTGTNSLQSVAKSTRRPNRPFGGRLSPAAARRVIVLRSRLAEGLITKDDVPVELLDYVRDVKKN